MNGYSDCTGDGSCVECGACLAACPVLGLDEKDAARAMRLLRAGRWSGVVLDRCTGCMACDALCPRGARPYALLLSFYAERYARRGIPRVFMNAMPQREGPNLWSALERWLSPAEKGDLARWARPPRRSEVLFLGCNQRLTPYVATASFFRGLEIFSDPDMCCGEYFLRLGLFEQARRKASALAARFRAMGIERVIAFCPACQNTMQHLAPNLLGVSFEVQVVGLVEWLAEAVGRGSFALSRPLSGTVTVQDPCHASGLGPAAVAAVRSMLAATGLTVVEMEHCGTLAECCGLGASLARYRLTDVATVALRRAGQARRTGAGITCAWCNGCYMVMNMGRLLYPAQPPVFHLVELLQLASGEAPARRQPARGTQLLAAAVEATARDRFRFARTHL